MMAQVPKFVMMQTHGDFFYWFICRKEIRRPTQIGLFLYFHFSGAAVRARGRCSLCRYSHRPRFIWPRALRGSRWEPPWGAAGTPGQGSREVPSPAASLQAQAGLASTAPGARGGAWGPSLGAPEPPPGILVSAAGWSGRAPLQERSGAEAERGWPGRVTPAPGRHRPFLSWPRPGSGSSAGRRGPAPSPAERPRAARSGDGLNPEPAAGGDWGAPCGQGLPGAAQGAAVPQPRGGGMERDGTGRGGRPGAGGVRPACGAGGARHWPRRGASQAAAYWGVPARVFVVCAPGTSHARGKNYGEGGLGWSRRDPGGHLSKL